MRHFTWAVTWIAFGLAVTLGTATVLHQIALRHELPPPQAIDEPAPTIKPKPSEQMRSVVVASCRHRDND
jgi:hypothetical protein